MEPDLPMTIAYSEHQLTLDAARTDGFLGIIADRYRDETVRMNKELTILKLYKISKL